MLLAFPANIGRKLALPVRGSCMGRQRLHAGERYTPASEMDLVSLNMAAPVKSMRSEEDNPKTLDRNGVYIYIKV